MWLQKKSPSLQVLIYYDLVAEIKFFVEIFFAKNSWKSSFVGEPTKHLSCWTLSSKHLGFKPIWNLLSFFQYLIYEIVFFRFGVNVFQKVLLFFSTFTLIYKKWIQKNPYFAQNQQNSLMGCLVHFGYSQRVPNFFNRFSCKRKLKIFLDILDFLPSFLTGFQHIKPEWS